MTSCDRCDQPSRWLVFAAYPIDLGGAHPALARYPAPLARACDLHLPPLMTTDAASASTTGEWLVMPA